MHWLERLQVILDWYRTTTPTPSIGDLTTRVADAYKTHVGSDTFDPSVIDAAVSQVTNNFSSNSNFPRPPGAGQPGDTPPVVPVAEPTGVNTPDIVQGARPQGSGPNTILGLEQLLQPRDAFDEFFSASGPQFGGRLGENLSRSLFPRAQSTFNLSPFLTGQASGTFANFLGGGGQDFLSGQQINETLGDIFSSRSQQLDPVRGTTAGRFISPEQNEQVFNMATLPFLNTLDPTFGRALQETLERRFNQFQQAGRDRPFLGELVGSRGFGGLLPGFGG